MGGTPNDLTPIPTYPKESGKSATTDWAQHVGSSSGLITIVMMTLLKQEKPTNCGTRGLPMCSPIFCLLNFNANQLNILVHLPLL